MLSIEFTLNKLPLRCWLERRLTCLVGYKFDNITLQYILLHLPCIPIIAQFLKLIKNHLVLLLIIISTVVCVLCCFWLLRMRKAWCLWLFWFLREYVRLVNTESLTVVIHLSLLVVISIWTILIVTTSISSTAIWLVHHLWFLLSRQLVNLIRFDELGNHLLLVECCLMTDLWLMSIC